MDEFINKLSYHISNFLVRINLNAMKYKLKQYEHIDKTVIMGSNTKFIGPSESFFIGRKTYINDAMITAGRRSKVIIGTNCAIGYRVSIKAITHDINDPCPKEQGFISTIESDIKIGDFCWIGDNVFIREGITLGKNVIVGANSVVTKSFSDNVIIAGVPAKIIMTKKY